jgi:hypothetical protein
MKRRWLRLRGWWVLGAALGAAPAAADDAGFRVELSCRPEAAPGRVLCELKYSVSPRARLTWADALVTAAPEFARPLRSRVAPERFGPSGVAERKLSLAFVAARPGVGPITVRARAVVCEGQGESERCRPRTEEVRTEIRVGS